MDSSRFLLITAWFVVLMLLYQAWQADYDGTKSAAAGQAAIPPGDHVEAPAGTNKTDIPNTPTMDSLPDQQETAVSELAQAGHSVMVHTDNYRLQISLQGAGIVKAELVNYPVSIKEPDRPFVLMDNSENLRFIAQGGLLSVAGAPTHMSEFRADQEEYSLLADQTTMEVPFQWSSGDGIVVRKVYEFRRGDYQIGIRYEIINDSANNWTGQSYTQIKRNNPGRSSMFGTYTYTGAVISSPESRYEKISFDDIEEQELQQDIVDGWAAMIQHYFVTALIPANKSASYRYYTNVQADGNFAIGVLAPSVTVAPGETKTVQELMYIGPKIHKLLEKTATGLELTVDYGVLWFIAKPLFWCLSRLHELTRNWGWSIILVTLVLKLLFYPLSATSYRSMANMRKVQPRIMSIRDRYQNDKARLNQAMMQIYKEEKINPFGGCLPILVQIPVFLALYWVLLETVEMRQSGFIFWLADLSSPDPYYVLPLLMGITMFIQQKLSPAPPDPVQAKVMSVLPVVFTVFFAFFQSGLVLYWVVNNTLSILQQWLITRNMERSGLQPKKS